MDFSTIGSLNQYTKSLALKTQWKLKKQSGDFKSHRKSLGDYVSFSASSLNRDQEEKDDRLSAILTKAQAGKKLSQAEWEYLRAKDPVMYEKLRQIEEEQKHFEEALKHCKTRDEVIRLHVSKLSEIMSAAKEGDSSAIIRVNRTTQTMVEFTESAEYRELPTEAEEAIERESRRQAKEESRQATLREAEEEIKRLEAAIREAVAEMEKKTEKRSDGVTEEPEIADSVGGRPGESDAAAESVSIGEGASGWESISGFGNKIDAADDAGKGAAGGFSIAGKNLSGSAADEPAPAAMAFGQRAYLKQQGLDEYDVKRRRAVDRDA